MPGFFVHSKLNNLKYHISFTSLTVDRRMMVFKMTIPLLCLIPKLSSLTCLGCRITAVFYLKL